MSVSHRSPLVLPVYLPSFILAFGRGMLIPTLPLYARSFGVSYGLVGIVLSAEGIGRLAGNIPGGLLLNRFSRKQVMVAGVVLVVLSLLPLYWADAIWQVVLLRCLAGFGGSMWNLSRHAYVAKATTVAQRGRALATFGGINRIGVLFGPVVGGVVATWIDLETPFLIYALLAAAVCVISAVAVEDEPPGRAGPHGPGGLTVHLRLLVRVIVDHRRTLSTAGLGQMLAQGIRAGRQVVVPLYASDVVGLAPGAIGTIISVAGFLDMAMFYPAGLIMDRLGRKFAIVPCFLIQGIGMGLIPLTSTFTGLLMAACVLGLGNGIGSGSMMTLGADLAPEASVGAFLGVWRLIGDGGSVGSPLAVGALADVLGLSIATILTAGLGPLAAATFAGLMPETLKRRPG